MPYYVCNCVAESDSISSNCAIVNRTSDGKCEYRYFIDAENTDRNIQQAEGQNKAKPVPDRCRQATNSIQRGREGWRERH